MSNRDPGDETDEQPGMNVPALIEICHQNAHAAEHNHEDGVLISLTKREVWLTTLAYLVLAQSAPCLEDHCSEVTERLIELLDVQKPHWRGHPL